VFGETCHPKVGAKSQCSRSVGMKEKNKRGNFPSPREIMPEDDPEFNQPSVWFLRSQDLLESIDALIEWGVEESQMRKIIEPMAGGIFNWATRNSLWPLELGVMCCSLEFGAGHAPKYDIERLGVLARASPRQCDVLLVSGPISLKFGPKIRRLYDQMPEPKFVMALGECAISGGPFYESYAVYKGCDQLFPVDIYVPGCAIRPESYLDGIIKLKIKIEEAKRRAIQKKRFGEGEGLKSRQQIDEGNYKPTEVQLAQNIGQRKPGDKKLEKLNLPVATQPNLKRD